MFTDTVTHPVRAESPDPARRRAEGAQLAVAQRLLTGPDRHPAVAGVGLGPIAPEPVVVVLIYANQRHETDAVLALVDHEPTEVQYLEGPGAAAR